jgi:molybdopterin/thiamine biosynthesis adenylyltransferase
MRRSAALTTETHEALSAHLDRVDGQEDLTFALYRPSTGATRRTGIVHELLLPRGGERNVHGNVAFTGDYLLRALEEAADADAGLVLLHSHPGGSGWQGMSPDDIAAEHGNAGKALAMTGYPLLGMTLGTGEMSWSARFWERSGGRDFKRRDCETVRVVGHQMRLTFNEDLRPPPVLRQMQVRTVSAWGPKVQADLARLRIAVIGAGSVGSLVAEALARTGIEHIVLIDFDTVELHNLDRLLHATHRDVRLARSKVECLKRGLLHSATAADPRIDALEASVVEEPGLAAALDCDVIFSCVDRPWPRSALNFLAYAHLIPVIDGGIRVVAKDERLVSADWKAHVAAPGRSCLECLRQYDPGLVAVERDGHLDDPSYIDGLPANHPLISSENVFAFSASTASMEVLQLLSMLIAPSDIADIGAQNYHFVTGELDIDQQCCQPNCLYAGQFLATGDTTGLGVTGRHTAAEDERAARAERAARMTIRLRRWIDERLHR